MGRLARFGVAMDEDLLGRFDALVERRGAAANRSEAVRDLVRDALVNAEWEDSSEEIVATVTMVFNHGTSDLSDKLDALQHAHHDKIVSAMHVHLDPPQLPGGPGGARTGVGCARHRRLTLGDQGRQARRRRHHHDRQAAVAAGRGF